MNIEQLIFLAREKKASDIHLSVGMPVAFRINGALNYMDIEFTNAECDELIRSSMSESQLLHLDEGNDIDFAIQTGDGNRQRINVFHQRAKLATTIRLLNNFIPSIDDLKLPPVINLLANQPRGMVLVTGPTGSGKSTTLASMIDLINKTKFDHIITIEDPIEYVYGQGKALIHQREIGEDSKSFAVSLRSALREDPDVILVGEMRDYETISAAVTAAETGHLVLSTLHTTGAAQTVDRIIDACPPTAQAQIRTQLSGMLRGIITQQLIPTMDGMGRIAATEVLIGTDAALNLIRESKCHQLSSVMQVGKADGMHTLNADLARLVYERKISVENAFKYSLDKKDLQQYIG
ncbi:MAG: type IV pilus twitching motility protein PilT [Clostridia bacterium]